MELSCTSLKKLLIFQGETVKAPKTNKKSTPKKFLTLAEKDILKCIFI